MLLLLLVNLARLTMALSSGMTNLPPTKTSTPKKTNKDDATRRAIVVTGATGRVGSRLVRRLLSSSSSNDVFVTALVRDAAKARSMFGDDPSSSSLSLSIVEVDLGRDREGIETALRDVARSSSSSSVGLFVACGNGPQQIDVERNIIDAAAEVFREETESDFFCVKLSTAAPLVEGSIGYGADHAVVEARLNKAFSDTKRCCVLRPHLFAQMLRPEVGGPIMGVDLANDDGEARHVLADRPMAVVDVDDVAACAAFILSAPDRRARHGGAAYELTGPRLVTIANEVARALRPSAIVRPLAVSDLGLPPAVAERLAPFLETLGSYDAVTDDVERILGRPATSVEEALSRPP